MSFEVELEEIKQKLNKFDANDSFDINNLFEVRDDKVYTKKGNYFTAFIYNESSIRETALYSRVLHSIEITKFSINELEKEINKLKGLL